MGEQDRAEKRSGVSLSVRAVSGGRLRGLSRGSGLFFGSNLLLCSAHVLHPFLFPQYFPQEFLKFVKPRDLRYVLEYTEEVGKTKEEAVISKYRFMLKEVTVHRHPHRDVGALSFSPSNSQFLPFRERFKVFDFNHQTLGKKWLFHGHNVYEGEDDMFSLHHRVRGHPIPFELQDSARLFCETQFPLLPGMCGGPVTCSETGSLVGLTEGTVKPPHVIGDAAIVLPLPALTPWLTTLA